MMKIAVKPNLKSKTFCSSKIYVRFKEKETGYFNSFVTGVKDGTRYKYDDPETQEEDYQTVDYAKFTPMLVAAFKELEARVTALEGGS